MITTTIRQYKKSLKNKDMTLSLDIYIFQLIKRVPNFQKADDEPVSFDEVYNTLSSSEDGVSPLSAFLKKMTQSFDKSFCLNNEKSKAISFCKGETFKVSSNGNVITGQFIGGTTGVQADVYENADATNSTHRIKASEVTALPYYFKLWFPTEFNTGVLIVQRYSIASCLSIFRRLLSDVFKDMGYKFDSAKFVPQEHRDQFLEDCNIVEIGVKHKDSIEDPTKVELDLLRPGKLNSLISNISLSAKKVVTDAQYLRKLKEEVGILDSNYTDDTHTLKFYYIDAKGQRASSTIEGFENMIPSVKMVSDTILIDGIPNWDEIDRIATKYLEAIKKDLKYTL